MLPYNSRGREKLGTEKTNITPIDVQAAKRFSTFWHRDI